jgi:bifunctional UDP-N-acetylglucosamine pyrophosphorylase / glucosamine-1-phosphate N-acetyltransferase
MKQISILILAAGKGTRMKSALPKVLHPVAGVPMVERVVRAAERLKPASVCVIVGHGGEEVRSHVRGASPRAAFAVQKILNGSGGAVRQALAWLKRQRGDVIVTCGDAPLIRRTTFASLLAEHRRQGNVATVLTTHMPNPFGYGRIVRAYDGAVERIVEHLDATDEERKLTEINSGTYCFNARALALALPKLKNDNAKKEFYLTDTLEILRNGGGRIGAVLCADHQEILGINSRAELAMAEFIANRRKCEELMAAGVTVVDPSATYVQDTVSVGPDTVLYPQTHLTGQTRVGSGCRIGPWAHVSNCVIENNVVLKASFADASVIRQGARVGPYSHIRPKSDIGPNAHMGNFSETKNTRLGAGSKLNHLSYLGDATVGKNVNIGAGTITCNYDGIQKFPTHIQDHAFVGSNTNLIAPVRVGAHAVIGAGSSISDDVPAWSLAVERAPIKVKKDWARAKFSRKGKKR